jgi:hypothetical protein
MSAFGVRRSTRRRENRGPRGIVRNSSEDIVTSDEFRKMALNLPEVSEGSHMGHADFRVGGKIFATLGVPGSGWGMVKLTPDEQEIFVQIEPGGFQPVKGGWGRQGATNVRLRSAKKGTVREALLTAWRNRAPKSLAQLDAGPRNRFDPVLG